MRSGASHPPNMPSLRFGPFTLDSNTGRLSRDGDAVPLPAQPMRALTLLVTRAGSIVSREELRAALWADRSVEFETGLHYCIHQVRTALDDDAKRPAYVETVPGQGYRFIARVRSRTEQATKRIAVAALAAVTATVVVLSGIVDLRSRSVTTIRGLDVEFGQVDRVPDGVLERVHAALDSVLTPWDRNDDTPSHRIILNAAYAGDPPGSIAWQFQLIAARSDDILAEGTLWAQGLRSGDEAVEVAEGVRGIIVAWQDREAPPVRRIRRVDHGTAPH